MPRATTCDHICWHPGCNGVFRAEVGEALAEAGRHAAASGHPQADYALLRKANIPAEHPLTCLFGTCSQSFPAPFGGEVKAALRHARKAGHPIGQFIRGPHPDGRVPAPKASDPPDLLGWLVIAPHVIAVISLIAGFITASHGGTYGICDDAYAFQNCTDPHQEVHDVANVLLTIGLITLLLVVMFWTLVFLSTPTGQFIGFMVFGLITSAASMGGHHHGGGRSAWGAKQPGGGWVSGD
ncbi:hypothetical protein OG365_41360 (plasmid) [Streptomyces sp. NBC_00853]|uniref:hypothetical protein n=1 Tax=Streptomyces sp. NBC_00853 TaxID=2903681 RepID=UPI002F91A26C|nr:hypothetical protein OG365_39485 [Streptomyces sp. NBC_00853]WTA24463.1 hypothetical protein OG365_41360 [Streptomyces sp. NBC_00853]